MARSRSGLPLIVLLCLAAALYALFIARTSFRAEGRPFFTLIDDAMISMRYAQHLAAGQGLVWNVGEPPIQGFTNPGWVFLMAALHALRLPQASISLAVMAVSSAILLAHVAVSYRICLVISPAGRLAPTLAAGLTAFYFPVVFWSLRGMEVGLLVLLLALAAYVALQRKAPTVAHAVGLGLLLSAALVVRLDAVLQAIVILAYYLTARHSVGNVVWLSALIPLATLLTILILQNAYFGDMLPNTYYQKMLGGALDDRLLHGLLMFLRYGLRDLLLLGLVAAAATLRWRESRSPEALLLSGLFIVQVMYSVWVGGDYAEPEVDSANRFIAQGVPALIVLAALALERGISESQISWSSSTLTWLVTLGIGLALLGATSGIPWYKWVDKNAPLLQADIRRVRAGLAIAANTSSDAVIAVHAAGQIPYYSGRRTIDLLGLNDPAIARGPRRTSFYPGHDKWNYEYSIGTLQPDLIADNWIRLRDYIAQRADYQKLENGMHVLVGTTRVDVDGLGEAYP